MNNPEYLQTLKTHGGYKAMVNKPKYLLIFLLRGGTYLGDKIRTWLYKKAFLSVGKKVTISRNVSFGGIYNIALGDGVFINQGCNLYGDFGLNIGDFTKLSPYVQIYSANYITRPGKTLGSSGTKGSPVLIGRNVWIGSGCVILEGVSIGDNSIVGALSVVNKNIPKNQLWAGNPAKFIKNL